MERLSMVITALNQLTWPGAIGFVVATVAVTLVLIMLIASISTLLSR